MSVAIGIVHGQDFTAPFVRSWTTLLRDRPLAVQGVIFTQGVAGRLDNSRNEVAARFMRRDVEWLLTIDTDIVFRAEDFDALVASGDWANPVVTGCYFVDEKPPRLAAARTEGMLIKSLEDWKEDALEPVDWCGAGFMLIHRSVFEAIGPNPYRQDVLAPNGDLVGEDYAFCHRAREKGFPIMLNTAVFLGHVKPRVLGWDT